jgi:UDP-N-acetylglucosamine--N-acetylmuramyl-(pentapeptide) pyrophosphoryl-undecaprenol N-acetylglucosamine transferase
MKKTEDFVLVMAGGTGGHVFPALAVAKKLQNMGVVVEWLGTDRGIEARVIPEEKIPLHFLPVVGVRGKSLKTLPGAVLKLLSAQWKALKLLYKLKPSCVLGMGGFASGPGALAAWMLRIPVVIHEQNAVLGTTNKILQYFATSTIEGFEGTFVRKPAKSIGNPVRAEIVALHKNEDKEMSNSLNILVLGGSLGARTINRVLPETIALLSEYKVRFNVIHQSGINNDIEVLEAYNTGGVENVEVVPFIKDMSEVYSWANIIISRAGALTVAELAMSGTPAILIPFPYAVDDHQTQNAKIFVNQGAGILIPECELNVKGLFIELNELIQDKEALVRRKEAAWMLAKPDASVNVAQECMRVINDD